MSAHLLQIGAERLATLPSGVLVYEDVSGYASRTDIRDGEVWLLGIPEPRRAASVGPLHLVLTDTVTAAVVAMRIVRLWSARAGVDAIAAIIGGTREEAWSTWCEVMAPATRHDPMSPEQTETLARLARAAMEAA